MDYISLLIDQYNIPLLTAFLTGTLTSISPCPLATNITAIAYISKDIKTPKNTLLSGLYYTLGRGFSYTILAWIIYLGFSSFDISRIFQGWGDKVLGPILVFLGLIMFDVIKLNIKTKNERIEQLKEKLAVKGYAGSFLLGCLFALAFCPYSGVLFFGVLVPLVLRSNEAVLLPSAFALGTGLPVIIFSCLIAFSMQKVGQAFSAVQKIEKISRKVIAAVFLLTGIYYLQFLIRWILT
ncbi:sulfite exporter TauE/SafE family protein [Patescibacteria group bacterium]|nr:sulfite exporter TauE/SafE family protein [Patescibacteria group bacterium]